MDWERMPVDVIRGILKQAGEEIDVPASLFIRNDFTNSFQFLSGRALNSLYEHARRATDRNGKDISVFLLDQAGITATADDAIQTARIGNRRNFWVRVPDEARREVLERAADEIGVPTFMLRNTDFTRRRYQFLAGNQLTALYDLSERAADRNGKSPISYLLEKVGITPSVGDIVQGMQIEQLIPWGRVPPETIQNLLEQAAEELGIPASMVSAKKLNREKFDFLHGKNLRGLIDRTMSEYGLTSKEAVELLVAQAGISTSVEDIIDTIKRNERVYWNRASADTLRQLLDFAAEEIEIPTSMLGARDLSKRKYEFLEGQSLGRLFWDLYYDQQRGDKKPVSYLFEKIEIKPSTEDVVAFIKTGGTVQWDTIPREVIADILTKASEETGLPVSILGARDLLYRQYGFLDDRSLGILYSYAQRRTRSIEETVLGALRKDVGLPDATSNRKGFRGLEMSKLFDKYMQGNMSETLQPAHFIPWLNAVSEIYANSFFGIEKNEVQNELFVFLSDNYTEGQNWDIETMITMAHRHIEKYVSTVISSKYREKSLAAPIGNTDLTLADTLTDKGEAGKTNQAIVFSRRTSNALESLSPLQRALVIGITVHEYTFDEMAGEIKNNFNLEADSDTLQEHYEEALAILKGQIEPKDVE